MTPTPNAAALAWADADPAGAVQAICTADSLRALRLQYVAMRRTWPATTNGRTREAVRSAIVVIRMAVRALGGGARLATPGAFKLSIRAGDGTALNLAAEPIYIVERSGMGAGIYASVHADGLPAMLAAVAVNVEGLSALAFLHRHSSPARTVEPFRPVKRASLARLHHAPARDAAHLPGFDLLPAAQSAQGTLPGFEPFTSGVPSWLLSMFDQAGASSSQRGRKGAPWSMRLWVYPLLMVKVAERDGRTVRLPTRLGDIERWIWPDGWDRSNRAKHWPGVPGPADRTRHDPAADYRPGRARRYRATAPRSAVAPAE